ncbi:bifunctional salicylyl-CoA 5-hydroxylase/oxidoreductase [Escherichia coli]|uniref:bifunctional salicylyl-CoA 5-hydroxylase/oxidoreductase n=1 Tax=Escherichia coli TaxID=562 RepID=UPI000BE1DF17|nr:bifunctional salicylyl-CoA 5-hydroxylase/oxidoreductase [Escherichia coli]EEZ9700334.1 bifunctional salicylyl-CoA 5-hydroxylase/oxidoreductase [Escherichia coli O1]EFE6985849.1 bifunctional salicylyl-CoA 5-hydroxylase/oxidoreductase [Escherichia coli]EFH5334137.1 bifunctional salicylyl-CoA 5-hydroxylase/oxidoreductase [Escherichia coli]EHO4837953.1 bifunctional salicylyl-CoA 5-hydroxylase/oxidoreductase [Escherichia coli]EIR5746787.1 bifunctional salicylyl-CoA 5-hydroxylase/oxidoreductase [
MNIVCIGGGPAGLYFALLMKLQNPANNIVVVERNRPYDTFGWGVVFSDATLENLRQADPVSAEQIARQFNRWDDIEIHFKDSVNRSGGHGFIGIGRKKLLNILQERCQSLGVELVFDTLVEDEHALIERYQADLVLASDGINSRIRTRYQEVFQPDIDNRQCRFVWLGTRKVFEAFTFLFAESPHGWFQVHAYQFEPGLSTFIVETTEETWKAVGLDQMSQEEGIAYCEKLFAPWLDGHPLMSNAAHLRGAAIWIRFPRVICQNWVHWVEHNKKPVPLVLMGDAAHTAHFSIGSGTKLALEDAIELANSLQHTGGELRRGLDHYQAVRGVEVLKIQNAARNSTEWFENVARYENFAPQQFAYSLLTRSQRISHENLRLRDPQWLSQYEQWLANAPDVPPILTPYQARSVVLKNRTVISPVLLYQAKEGVPGMFHLMHLGSRAVGGAGLVLTEMTAVSPQGRITPNCPGLWNDEQVLAWRQVTDFVHQNSGASIGVQLGHSGRRGSTQRGDEQPDHPLAQDNWPLISASPLPYRPGVSAVPAEATPAQLERVIAEFVDAARRAAKAGFDWLELQAGHGFLLSSFISPLTNQRRDDYGGSLENRLRFPLAVFRAVREVWPQHLPISVRISATDWVEGGTTVDDAVEIARRFREAGADMIACSSGEVSVDQKPVYGRMFQTPMADRLRNEGGIATMAVGAISDADQVNGIIASGRADLCAIGRPALADANWLQRECARYGWNQVAWHPAYHYGRDLLQRALRPQEK